ncbi:MAG: cytochrome-c peroxidase [Saprospiraceae bacterium]|nr:cytochrome-c peroxidase [Saprospiraceae bacterium]
MLLILMLIACQDEKSDGDLDDQLRTQLIEVSQGEGLSYFELPSSNDFARIPQDPNNRITEAKVDLGRLLYHETGLGINPKYPEGQFTYSCASCHHANAGFQAGLRQGIGEGGDGYGFRGETRVPNAHYSVDSLDVQPIRTPTAMNGAYQTNMLWNGQFGATGVNVGTEEAWTEGTPKAVNHLGYEGLEIQAIAGLTVHRMGIGDNVKNSAYGDYFENAFPGLTDEDLMTKETAGLAIAAYERTLLANNAPFQRWLKGNHDAMFRSEKRGAILFFGKAGCANCHTGPALNQMSFYSLGMPDLVGPGIYGSSDDNSAHLGRGSFTGRAEDDYKFKVPQLYNLRDSPFYGHGGTFRSVKEVIEYKNEGVPVNSKVPSDQISGNFYPLGLTQQEIQQITDFVENALYDDNLIRYEPNVLPSGLCFPNNDDRSREDRGCN